jgi:toxin HigB-1
VIVGFRHQGLQALYVSGSKKGVQPAQASKLSRILGLLDVAQSPADLAIPGYRAHELKGDFAGHWSLWVNVNWRVTFRFVGQDVELVDYQDYH